MPKKKIPCMCGIFSTRIFIEKIFEFFSVFRFFLSIIFIIFNYLWKNTHTEQFFLKKLIKKKGNGTFRGHIYMVEKKKSTKKKSGSGFESQFHNFLTSIPFHIFLVPSLPDLQKLFLFYFNKIIQKTIVNFKFQMYIDYYNMTGVDMGCV